MTASRNASLYALGKLDCAVRLLAIGEGDVRSRLLSAYRELAPISPDDFPPHLRTQFEWIKRSLTQYEPWGKEGRVAATMRRIRNATGSKIANRIVMLETELRTYCEDL